MVIIGKTIIFISHSHWSLYPPSQIGEQGVHRYCIRNPKMEELLTHYSSFDSPTNHFLSCRLVEVKVLILHQYLLTTFSFSLLFLRLWVSPSRYYWSDMSIPGQAAWFVTFISQIFVEARTSLFKIFRGVTLT